MLRKRINIGYRMMHWFTYHPWLKLIALILAILVWLWVRGGIKKY